MSNAQRNYLEDFDYRVYAHTASASQFEAFTTCPRKWWFSKVLRLPELTDQSKFVFGDVLHEVCERFLAADDQGRDEDGLPVDLYPEGWKKGLDDFDASIVKRLVTMGIEAGVLRRTPGRSIEKPVGMFDQRRGKHIPLAITDQVGLAGYRDLSAPGLVEDHKSIKTRTYMKSQAGLLSDPQMLLYGCVDMIEQVQAGRPIPDEVTLRHNQFIKNPDDLYVRSVEVQATREILEEFWEKVVEPAAHDMLRYKKMKSADVWPEIEGPRQKGACQKYGGCPFARICGNVETPDGYRARIQRINDIPSENELPSIDTKPQENEMAGIFKRMNSPQANVKAKPAAAAKPPKPTAAPKAAEPTQEPVQEPVSDPVSEVKAEEQEPTQANVGVTETTLESGVDPEEHLTSELEVLIGLWEKLEGLDWSNGRAIGGVKRQAKGMSDDALDLALAYEEAKKEGKPTPPRPGTTGTLTDIPRWAYDGCRACGGIGFNSRGGACAACDRRGAKYMTVLSSDFDISVAADGATEWSRNGDLIGRRHLQSAEVSADEKTKPPADSVQARAARRRGRLAPKPESEAGSAREPNLLDDEADEMPSAVRARPQHALSPTARKTAGNARGFLIVYGAVRRARMATLNLNDLFGTYAHELAESLGARSYYDLDRFKRGDLMAAKAEEIAETIPNNTIVVVRPDDQDIRKFAMALERFAANVIEGLG